MFYLPSHHMDQPLIVFYSLEWFTQKIAQTIATITHGKLLQLSPQQDISSTQNKWKKYFRWGKQVVMKETPPLKPYTCDIKSYNTIYIGTPVRAFTYTPAIRSFLQQTKIHNKKIVLFCTHEWSPWATLQKLKEALQDNTILASKDFNKKLLQNDPQLLQQEIQTFITHL